MEGLPKSKGMDVILVVVDRLTKSAHFLPLPHPYTVQDVVEIFMNNIHKLHGMPISLITDGTKSLPATASPKYSHLTETQYSPSPVEERVNQSEWWTGGTIANATTFQGLCVFHPPQIGEFSVPCNVSEKARVIIQKKEEILAKLKESLQVAQIRTKLKDRALTIRGGGAGAAHPSAESRERDAGAEGAAGSRKAAGVRRIGGVGWDWRRLGGSSRARKGKPKA